MQLEKAAKFLDVFKVFFVRHSSEHETSYSDRKVNENILPDADACDKIRLTGPMSGQLGPIHYCLLEESL